MSCSLNSLKGLYKRLYESRSKLPFTSFSLGGSCCAKIPKIDRGRPKTIGLFHLSEGSEKIPKRWKSIGDALIQKPRENKQVILMLPHIGDYYRGY